VGKHFSVNIMLQKESVKARLDTGISYTEFSYMLLQAYDFLTVSRAALHIQVGAVISGGTSPRDRSHSPRGGRGSARLVRHCDDGVGREVRKDGAGAIYSIRPHVAYEFYQFWRNADDETWSGT